MRAGSVARWYARIAVVSALGVAAFAFAAGPTSAAADSAGPPTTGGAAAPQDIDWQAPVLDTEVQVRTLDIDWQ